MINKINKMPKIYSIPKLHNFHTFCLTMMVSSNIDYMIKEDDLNFDIVNYPCTDSNIPGVPVIFKTKLSLLTFLTNKGIFGMLI